MSATTDPATSVESPGSVRRRRAARPRGARQLDSTALIYLVLVGVIIVSTVLTALEGRNFFSQGNIWAVLTAMSVLGLIAIGQTLVILVGSLDLSVPYVVSLATVVAAGGMKGLDGNIPAAVVNTLAVCAVIGLAMGLLVSVLHVHGFIASLGVGLIVSGYLATNYQGSHGSAAPDLRLLGRSGIVGWIPTSFLLLLACAVLVTLMLRYSRLGHHIYAIGGNRDVARMSGVRTVLPVVAAHVLCSVLVGLAALLLLSRTGVGSPDDRVAGPLRPAVHRGGRARRHPAGRRQGQRGRHDGRRRDLRRPRQRHGCHAGQPVPQGLRPRPGDRARRGRLRPPQRRTPPATLRQR